jgi:hypothetical protein
MHPNEMISVPMLALGGRPTRVSSAANDPNLMNSNEPPGPQFIGRYPKVAKVNANQLLQCWVLDLWRENGRELALDSAIQVIVGCSLEKTCIGEPLDLVFLRVANKAAITSEPVAMAVRNEIIWGKQFPALSKRLPAPGEMRRELKKSAGKNYVTCFLDFRFITRANAKHFRPDPGDTVSWACPCCHLVPALYRRL